MKAASVEKASIRVGAAENAFKDLQDIQAEADLDYGRFAIAWFSYLTAWKGVYTVLEQGAKDDVGSEIWFAAVKQARISDPLFAYLYHARNDEEHGLKRVVQPHAGSQLYEISDVGVEGRQLIQRFDPISGKMVLVRPDGGPIKLVAEDGPGFMLQPVSKRGGKEVHPPLFHKANPADTVTPLRAAELGLDHLRQLLEEAAKLV